MYCCIDGIKSEIQRCTIGDTKKPIDPKIDLVAYGRTSISGTGEPFTTIVANFENYSPEYRTQVNALGKFKLYVDPIVFSYIKVYSTDGCGNMSNTIKI